MASFPDPLRILDLAQTRASAVIAAIQTEQLDFPTPCDKWSVRDVINKLVASTLLFTSFGLREEGDPNLDLINPKELIGDDPVGIYNHAASLCREAWRSPGALDGMATSTIGEAKARSVLNARIFDTTILSWDISRACNGPNLIDEEQATYVLRVAEALVPAVRSHSSERYKTAVSTGDNASVLEKLIAATGRDPLWGSESS
ncbi:MAG: TIGR03086 family metal-binding protein [Actinomycetota bacterium]|nr:TIGR03086 family metal-binding protein [Actinomycetota bacterium]